MLGIFTCSASRSQRYSILQAILCIIAASTLTGTAIAQHVNERSEPGDWHYIGGDAGHTRSTPLNQISH